MRSYLHAEASYISEIESDTGEHTSDMSTETSDISEIESKTHEDVSYISKDAL